MTQEEREELVALLERLVACDSSNPPGRETVIAAQVVQELAGWGLVGHRVELAAGRSSVWAEVPGEQPGTLVLAGHLDTVAPSPLWQTPPLSLVPQDGRLIGLGACDMKGGVAVLLDSLRRVALQGGAPRHTVRLLLTADEESEYRGAAQLAGLGLLRDAVFVIEAEPSGGAVLHGERGAFWVRMRFQGREAHGSTPHEGANAILACSLFLAALAGRMAEAPDLPHFGPTSCNPGKIRGGRQPNIVAESCFVELDIRLGSLEEQQRIAALLDEEGARACRATGCSFTRELISELPPLLTPPDDPWVQRFCQAASAALGREVQRGVAGYCTDLPYLFRSLPTPPPFVIFGPGDIRQAHQPDEFVSEQALGEVGDVLWEFLRRELFG